MARHGGAHRRGRLRRRGDSPCAVGFRGREHSRRRRGGAAASSGHLRQAARCAGRGSHPDRTWHGQAGRPGAELLLGHRSGVPVLPGRTDRWPARHRERGIFQSPGPGTDPAARCAQRGWFRVSGGYAPASLRRQRRAGGEPGFPGALPAGARARLGTLRLDQGARHRRCGSLRAGDPGIRAALRVPPLSGLRGDRVPARHEGAHRPRGVAP